MEVGNGIVHCKYITYMYIACALKSMNCKYITSCILWIYC